MKTITCQWVNPKIVIGPFELKIRIRKLMCTYHNPTSVPITAAVKNAFKNSHKQQHYQLVIRAQ